MKGISSRHLLLSLDIYKYREVSKGGVVLICLIHSQPVRLLRMRKHQNVRIFKPGRY